MRLKRKIAAVFKRGDEAWLCRANPWTQLMFLIGFVSFAIVGWIWPDWRMLLPLILMSGLFVFPKPRSTNNWISKGILGQRVWLNRDQVLVPQHHRHVPNLLIAITNMGMVLLGFGLLKSNLWSVVFGCTLAILGKLWYLDRMVWLYGDMKDVNPEYRSWLY